MGSYDIVELGLTIANSMVTICIRMHFTVNVVSSYLFIYAPDIAWVMSLSCNIWNKNSSKLRTYTPRSGGRVTVLRISWLLLGRLCVDEIETVWKAAAAAVVCAYEPPEGYLLHCEPSGTCCVVWRVVGSVDAAEVLVLHSADNAYAGHSGISGSVGHTCKYHFFLFHLVVIIYFGFYLLFCWLFCHFSG